jgi:hypothetical protein
MKTQKFGRRNGRKGGMPQWLQNTFRRMKEGMHYGYESLKGRATRMREGVKQGFQSVRTRARKYFYPTPAPHIEAPAEDTPNMSTPRPTGTNLKDIYNSRDFQQYLLHADNTSDELRPPVGFIAIKLRSLFTRQILIVKETDTVAYVKYILFRGDGLLPQQVELSFGGKELKDEDTLGELGIRNRSTIHYKIKIGSTTPKGAPRSEAWNDKPRETVASNPRFVVHVIDQHDKNHEIVFNQPNVYVLTLKLKLEKVAGIPFANQVLSIGDHILNSKMEQLTRGETYKLSYRPSPRKQTMQEIEATYNSRNVHYQKHYNPVPPGYILVGYKVGRGYLGSAILKESDTIGYYKYVFLINQGEFVESAYLGGILLDDDFTLADYGITNNDWIEVRTWR